MYVFVWKSQVVQHSYLKLSLLKCWEKHQVEEKQQIASYSQIQINTSVLFFFFFFLYPETLLF